MFADVGNHIVVDIRAGFGRFRLVTRRDSGRVNRFVEVRHFDQFFFDVRDFFDTVVIGNLRRRADKNIADTAFADVGTAVITGEPFDQH